MRLLLGSVATIFATGAFAAQVQVSIETLGLKDSAHTTATGAGDSYIRASHSAGYIVGYSRRYDDPYARPYNINLPAGSAWLYDGNQTIEIGLKDAKHTSKTGHTYSLASSVNSTGQAIGYATGYNDTGINGYLDVISAWLYNGNSTVQIGLSDAEHTNQFPGDPSSTSPKTLTRHSSAVFLNDNGVVAGTSQRYFTGEAGSRGIDAGRSAWVYENGQTKQIGLTGTLFTQPDYGNNNLQVGYKNNELFGLGDNGTVIGSSLSYNNFGQGQSFWAYKNGITSRIGFIDDDHTRKPNGDSGPDGGNYQYTGYTQSETPGLGGTQSAAPVNASGQTIGYSESFGGSDTRYGRVSTGASAWLYDGNTTRKIGLTDTEHSYEGYSRKAYTYSENYSQLLNENGDVAGIAKRYAADGTNLGQSAWIYKGVSAQKIGLTDTEHTDAASGSRNSSPDFLNDVGKVAGTSTRYTASGSAGTSTWVYDGNTTKRTGLTDASHTGSAGERWSKNLAMNEGGQVAGESNRYDENGAYQAKSIWLYDGLVTYQVGLEGAEYEDPDGVTHHEFGFLADNGFVAGSTNLYSAEAYFEPFNSGGSPDDPGYWSGGCGCYLEDGSLAWMSNGSETVVFDGLSQNAEGYETTRLLGIFDDGSAMGVYRDYDNPNVGWSTFGYSDEWGLFKIDMGQYPFDPYDLFADESGELSLVKGSSLSDVIGNVATGDYGSMAYRMSIVPVPPAVWLFASGLGALGWLRRKPG